MKKQLLIASLVLATACPFVHAQNIEPTTGNRSDNLTLEWYGVPTGEFLKQGNGNSRSGIGVNGKFYITLNNKGVGVYNKEGQIKMITNPTTWVSINCDDAGHVYFRNDKGGWPGSAGNYNPANAQYTVIDSKTDNIVGADIPLTSTLSMRFDALPHLHGNMLEEYEVMMYVPTANAGPTVAGFFLNQLEVGGFEVFSVNDAIKDFPTFSAAEDAKKIQTLGSAQAYGHTADGKWSVAVCANPQVHTTFWANGWANNIAKYDYEYDEVKEAGKYTFSGKWFNTPNHSSVGGFMVFEYKGTNYIVYPTGMFGEYPSGDGFFVMEEELVDTPKNKTAADFATVEEYNKYTYDECHKAVAYHYATDGIQSGNNWRGINVEPIEGQDGKFRIYFYNPGLSMQVWQLDLTGSAGVSDIIADTHSANIYGGVGCVVCDGDEVAYVYTPAGKLVTKFVGTASVAPGLYIVKSGTSVAKVIVK